MYNKKKKDLVILAGGRGTRIKKLLKKYPKPMLKCNKKHFLSYIINYVCKFNFRKIFILTGYKSEIIFKKFNNKEFNFINIECIKEKNLLGTGGALKNLSKKVNDFILINGDTLFNINLTDFIKTIKPNALGSIALVKNKKQESLKLHKLILKKNLVQYNDKGNFMNGGVYFFKKNFLKFIVKKQCSLENDVLPKLIKKKKISGKYYNNFFIDIGSEKTYKKAPKLLLKNLKKPAVFLDRDGVINYDYNYVYKLKKFKFRKGVLRGLKYLSEKNYYIFIVTNQAGIGKKIFTLDQFKKLHLSLKSLFLQKNIFINDVKYSPYHTKAKIIKFKRRSNYRKPGNLMVKKIFSEWDIELEKSFMIGDKKSDYLVAKKSKLKFFYPQKNFYTQIKQIINNY